MKNEINTSIFSVIDGSPTPMLLIDEDYTIIYCNEAWAEAINTEYPEDVTGESALKFLPEPEHPDSKQRLNTVIESDKQVEEREYTFITVDGKQKVANGTIIPTKSKYAHVILEDISEMSNYKRQIEELHNAAVDLASPTSRQEIFDKIVETMDEVLELDICSVDYVDEEKTLRHGASTNVPEDGYHEPDIYDKDESGHAGFAYRNNEILVIDNAQEDSRGNPQADYKSIITVPEHDIVIQAASFKEGVYTQTHANLVSILAKHAREALLRLERENELEEQRNRIERLHSVGIELTACESPQRASELMVEAAEDILGIDYCLVDFVSDGRLTVVAKSSGLEETSYHEPPINSEEAGLGAKAYRTGKSILVNDSQEHPDANPQDEYHSALTVPIGEFGVFQAVAYEEVGFTETDRELVELVAGHVEQALRQLEQNQELRQQRNEIELLQSVFSRVFRHNVKNELQVIKGNGEMIKTTAESDSISHGADILLESTERLEESTQKAREVETVVREQREVQTGSLRRIVSTAVADHKRAYSDSTIIEDVADVEVSAIIGVEKAVSNAVENALEHNSEPVTVELQSVVTEETVTLRITDDGSGIPNDELAVLDDESETALKHGSGVGLWLMKWSVEKSNGELTIANTENGTLVEMELPLAE